MEMSSSLGDIGGNRGVGARFARRVGEFKPSFPLFVLISPDLQAALSIHEDPFSALCINSLCTVSMPLLLMSESTFDKGVGPT